MLRSTVGLLTFYSDNVASWLASALLPDLINWVEAELVKNLNYWILKIITCFTFKESR